LFLNEPEIKFVARDESSEIRENFFVLVVAAWVRTGSRFG